MVLGVVFAAGLALAAEAPVGKWQTIDEKTGKPVSEVQITEQGGTLTGTITGLTEPDDKAGKPKTCTACKGRVDGRGNALGVQWCGERHNGPAQERPRKRSFRWRLLGVLQRDTDVEPGTARRL